MKRFTETTKWADAWYRKLPPHLKCLWQYLTDSCDGAGVIDPDWELVSFQIGASLSAADLAHFGERIEVLSNGKLWIVKFIEFQCGAISADCKAHKPIFKSIETNKIERVSKGYSKGIDTLQEKEKDKDKEEERDMEEGSGEKPAPDLVGIVDAYPRRQDVKAALDHLAVSIKKGADPAAVLAGTRAIAAVIPMMPSGHLNGYVPTAATFFRNERWRDDPQTWLRNAGKSGAKLEKLDLGGRKAGELIRVGPDGEALQMQS